VRLNVEPVAVRAWLVSAFAGSLRRRVPERDWPGYLLVRHGLDDGGSSGGGVGGLRAALAMTNAKVGYTYLVDARCRIRWAASGPARPEEREGLVRGLRRILDEMEAEGRVVGRGGK